ncbi:DUF317 domain-containing protein [Streptomyces sp. NPDC004111]|uniref:DUF317 domain-containing protein n=1 Tax=Streptomyces sp. NPDC004111 TaxID=3364690 RepID=UPI00368D3194
MTIAPHERVLISPRYLAGAGLERLGEAIGPLVHRAGWATEQNRDTGYLALHSPDGAVSVALDTGNQRGEWWTVTHQEPFWQAEFTRQAPIEAIGVMLYHLPQITGDHRFAAEVGPLPKESPFEIAARYHWQPAPGAGSAGFRSPDGHCAVTHHPTAAGSEPAWVLSHHVHDGFDTHWDATFTAGTPAPLVAAFLSNLADSFPVERVYRDIPLLVRDAADALITPVRAGGMGPQITHALGNIARIPPTPPGRPRSR